MTHLQLDQTSSREVQLLLWAVGEARDLVRGRRANGHDGGDDGEPAEGAEFFTEWQPATN